ncbi:non-ribosomal peptide synthetase [Nocardia sp. NPDC051911]|uniref:non-ribosomal peptide synthetase n=1 Tax=Nocardia sp. NPDC051911 TaxID=3154648 RepID=UPI00342C28EE
MAFHQLFEWWAARCPDAIAVRAENAATTYRELNHRANQLAQVLRDRGVGSEVTVGLCLPRDVRMIVAVLGVLKAGGAYVPVDPHDAEARRNDILDDAETRIVLTSESSANRAAIRLDADWSVLEGWPAANPTAVQTVLAQAAYVLYTSGSTGTPKGVVVEHRQLMAYTRAVLERFEITEPLRFAMLQPLSVDSSVTSFVPPLCTGGEVHLLSRDVALDAGQLAHWIQEHGVDCLKIAPSHLRALQVSEHFAGILPRRLLIVGGEPVDWQWLRSLQRMAPECRVVNHYGPTETTVGTLTLAVADHPDADWHRAPIGVPLPGTRVQVADERGEPVPDGAVGELLISGANVARGYLRRPGLTAATFVTGADGVRRYRTGDYVSRLPDGTITFVGRRDDQVKVRGFRVELGEIDATLNQDPSVHNAITVVREDTSGDRRIVAYVEPDDIDLARLDREVRAKLPAHMVPQYIVALPRLPLSGHGKVDRTALPAPQPPDVAPARPASDLDRLVIEAWRDVLCTEVIGMDQNFFDIGGHSLRLTELQHRLRIATGREVELLDLFHNPTVRAQARFLAGHVPAAARAERRARRQPARAKRGRHE